MNFDLYRQLRVSLPEELRDRAEHLWNILGYTDRATLLKLFDDHPDLKSESFDKIVCHSPKLVIFLLTTGGSVN